MFSIFVICMILVSLLSVHLANKNVKNAELITYLEHLVKTKDYQINELKEQIDHMQNVELNKSFMKQISEKKQNTETKQTNSANGQYMYFPVSRPAYSKDGKVVWEDVTPSDYGFYDNNKSNTYSSNSYDSSNSSSYGSSDNSSSSCSSSDSNSGSSNDSSSGSCD